MKFNEFKQLKQTKFSSLTILDELDSIANLSDYVWFRCDCGNRIKTNLRQVVNRKRTSCVGIVHVLNLN